MPENPDAEKAALAEALELWSKWFIVPVGQRKGRFKIIADKTDALLANLSPAAKEILEKAQAHDEMRAALELAQSYHDDEYDAIRCPVCEACGEPDEKLEHEQDCPIRVALAGKEPE